MAEDTSTAFNQVMFDELVAMDWPTVRINQHIIASVCPRCSALVFPSEIGKDLTGVRWHAQWHAQTEPTFPA